MHNVSPVILILVRVVRAIPLGTNTTVYVTDYFGVLFQVSQLRMRLILDGTAHLFMR